MSQNIRRYLEEVSDNIFIIHFCQFQPKSCDAKCILLATGNWFDQFDRESYEICFSKQSF